MRGDMMAQDGPHAEQQLELCGAHTWATDGQLKHDAGSLIRIVAHDDSTTGPLQAPYSK